MLLDSELVTRSFLSGFRNASAKNKDNLKAWLEYVFTSLWYIINKLYRSFHI